MTIARILGGLIFLALAMGFGALAVGFAYETIAYTTGVVPTVSALSAEALIAHPKWGRVLYFLIGVGLGALATHFAHWLP